MKFNIKSEMLKKYNKYILLIMAIAILMTFVDLSNSRTPVKEIDRPIGKDEIEETYLTYKTNENDGDVVAEIGSKALSESECKKYIEKAKKEIDETIQGENRDKEHILKNLDMRDKYADGYVEAMFSFDPSELINVDGSIDFSTLKEDTIVNVSCALEINEISEIYEFPIKVLVPSSDDEEGFMYYLSKALTGSNEKSGEKYILPSKVDGKEINFFLPFDKRGPELLLTAFLTIPLILILEKEKKKKEKKEYQKELSTNYAVIVEKLALFVNAGIRPKEAFKRIVAGQKKLKKKGEKNAGYREIEESLRAMENGQSEASAYVALGDYTNNKDFRRLSLLLSENIKKGDRFLRDELMKEEKDAFEKRKHMALSLGEEASTKMIIPMIILLMVIMVLLILPAWMSMGI